MSFWGQTKNLLDMLRRSDRQRLDRYTQDAIAQCYALGVDGIITDYPERCTAPTPR